MITIETPPYMSKSYAPLVGIDWDKLAAEVRALGTENPDYVYKDEFGPECALALKVPETGEIVPACIVGQALVKMGYKVDALYQIDQENNPVVTRLYREITGNEGNENTYPTSVRWLRMVQSGQDTKGVSWGTAISEADIHIENGARMVRF